MYITPATAVSSAATRISCVKPSSHTCEWSSEVLQVRVHTRFRHHRGSIAIGSPWFAMLAVRLHNFSVTRHRVAETWVLHESSRYFRGKLCRAHAHLPRRGRLAIQSRVYCRACGCFAVRLRFYLHSFVIIAPPMPFQSYGELIKYVILVQNLVTVNLYIIILV